jgi:hypothetical protein
VTGITASIPGEVRFRRGPAWRATVTGPQAAVERLRFTGSHLQVSAPVDGCGAASLRVERTGPVLEGITMNGAGEVTLDDLAQPSLEVEIRGSGTVMATGTERTLKARVTGSGEVRQEGVATDQA